MLEHERRTALRGVGLEVGERDRRAGRGEVRCDRAREIAAVEIREPRARELLERRGELRLEEERPGGRDVAAGEEHLGEPRLRLELLPLRGGVDVLAARDGDAGLAVVDRVGQEARERQLPAELAAHLVREPPAGDRAGDGVGGDAAAERDRAIDAALRVPADRRTLRRRAAGVDAHRLAPRHVHQPERIAADRVHVRVHHGDRRGGGDHRLDRVAAFAQHRERGLGGERVRRDRHAARASGGVQHEGSGG